jgi:hypothetical protein
LPSKSKTATVANKPGDEAVRHRAYLLWEADGRPHGKSEHYWHLAMNEINGETSGKPGKAAKTGDGSAPAKSAGKPARKPEPAVKKASPKPRAAVSVKKPGKGATAPA